MAFDPTAFSAIVQTLAGGQLRIFAYATSDDLEIVSEVGYFIRIGGYGGYGAKVGDLIVVIVGAASVLTSITAIDEDGNGTIVATETQNTLRHFGAIGDGIVDDTTAVVAAFASGLQLDGEGLTYGVNGNVTIPDGIVLEDAVFKQLAPNVTNRRTLVKTTGSGPITFRRVAVDRNGATTDGTISDTAGIWIANIDDIYFEDVEVYGNGLGAGINLISCDRIHLVRPHVHDMRWGAATDPGSEKIVGLWVQSCTNVRIEEPHIHELTGEVFWGSGQVIDTTLGLQWRHYGLNAYKAASDGTTGATPPTHISGTVSDGAVDWLYVGPSATNARAYQCDGLDPGGCTNVSVEGGHIYRVWEGTDISGSAINRNIWFYGTVFENCDAYGYKAAHRCYDSGCVGVRSIGAGRACFIASSGNNLGDRGDNIKWIGCNALDAGAVLTWPGVVASGFHVSGAANAATNVLAAYCLAIDRQTVPTMTIGFRNEPALPANFVAVDCRAVGYTSSEFNGFTTGNVQLAATDGSISISGDMAISAKLTTRDLRATRFLQTSRQAVVLANGLNSDIVISSSYLSVSGPSGAFSVGGFINVNTTLDGTHLYLHNPSAFDMTIVSEDLSSVAANRILTLATGGDVVMTAQSFAHFIYNVGSSRWIMVSSNG